MNLKAYFDKYKVSKTEFAAKIGTTTTNIYFYITKKRIPRQEMAEKIEAETDGTVTVFELRGKDDRRK